MGWGRPAAGEVQRDVWRMRNALAERELEQGSTFEENQ